MLVLPTTNDCSLQHYAWLRPYLCLCIFLCGQYAVKFSCLFPSLSSSVNDSTELPLKMLQHIIIDCLGYCRNDPIQYSTHCGLGFVATETINLDGNTVPGLSICAVCKCPAAALCLIS